MCPRAWTVVLWVLLVSTTAAARETRQGTVLVASHPGGPPPVLYVAARLSTLVVFEDLSEPRALLTSGPRERVQVLPMGAHSLVVVPLRDLETGERVLLPVAGWTEAGEPLTVTLALATRRDEVDLEARVTFGSEWPGSAEAAAQGEMGVVAGMLLASHAPDTSPKLALLVPGRTRMLSRAEGVRVQSLAALPGPVGGRVPGRSRGRRTSSPRPRHLGRTRELAATPHLRHPASRRSRMPVADEETAGSSGGARGGFAGVGRGHSSCSPSCWSCSE